MRRLVVLIRSSWIATLSGGTLSWCNGERKREKNMSLHVSTPAIARQHQYSVPSADVDRYLDIYLPEHRYVRSAILRGTVLSAVLAPSAYPYTATPLFSYVTATTAAFYLGQLAYVLIAAAISERTIESSLIPDVATFLRFRDEGLLQFVDMKTRFSREISARCRFEAIIEVDSLCERSGCIMTRVLASLDGGACDANILTVARGLRRC
jgi:hypothetical protein